MKKNLGLGLTTKYILAFGALLLAANILLGVVIITQSTSALTNIMRKNMLDISTTAATLLDGDDLGALTEEDVGGPVFNEILQELTAFQENIDIEYIYTVRQVGEEEFVFVVDADPEEPAAFGQETVITPALLQAAKGVAAVDDMSVQDQWGSFYTAYSPVLDSSGRVAGIVGVDFDAKWYEDQIGKHTLSIGIISILSVVACAGVVLLITNRVKRGFRDLEEGIVALSEGVEELTREIASKPGYRESYEPAVPSGGTPADEISALGEKIHSMQREMTCYLDYVHAQANTDALTGVGNTTAYQALLEDLEKKIAEESASFAVAVFDVDNLKGINDQYGHACGDMIIRAAGAAMIRIFGQAQSFRVGGDEFLAVVEGATERDMAACLAEMERAAEAFNASERPYMVDLSVSAGAAAYRPGEDRSFRAVFIRADQSMYRQKDEHHHRMGKS